MKGKNKLPIVGGGGGEGGDVVLTNARWGGGLYAWERKTSGNEKSEGGEFNIATNTFS